MDPRHGCGEKLLMLLIQRARTNDKIRAKRAEQLGAQRRRAEAGEKEKDASPINLKAFSWAF